MPVEAHLFQHGTHGVGLAEGIPGEDLGRSCSIDGSSIKISLSDENWLHVAANQGQSQLRNLLNQAFEPAIFVDLCTDLLREIDGNINRGAPACATL